MERAFSEYIYLFAIFSLSGWVLEFIFRSLRLRKLTNPGFLRGPYLPIYGTGAVFLYLASLHLSGSHILIKVLAYFVITTGLEFTTGFFLEEFFHIRLWDYSKESLRVKNYICLKYSLCWVILAFACEYLFLPAALYFYRLSPHVLLVAGGIAFLMLMESALKFGKLLAAKEREKAAVDVDELQAFSQIIKHLLLHPEVAKLAHFRHHRMITRLDHCLEVAWLSYVLARRFSLDGAAAARGGLLHDLFLYEWLTEGPRLHGFRHPRICVENARKVTSLSEKEEDIIRKHMWPLTFSPPRYIESWIVCFVDTHCTVKDYLAFAGAADTPDLSAHENNLYERESLFYRH